MGHMAGALTGGPWRWHLADPHDRLQMTNSETLTIFQCPVYIQRRGVSPLLDSTVL